MQKALFILFTIISLVCYGFALYLLQLYYTQENAATSLLIFIPVLIIGLLSGLIALGIKSFLKLVMPGFLGFMYIVNIVLLVLGSVVFLYYFFTM